MNRSSKRILSVATALALVIGAYAATNGFAQGMMGATSYHGMGPAMIGNNGYQSMGPGMMGGHTGFTKMTTDTAALNKYLAEIKSRLVVTAAQESAWNTYAGTIREQTTSHNDIHNTMHATTANTTMDWNQQHLDNMERVIQQQKTAIQAFRTFYQQLDAQQQSVAGQLTWSHHG